jgi:hypothetical protein
MPSISQMTTYGSRAATSATKLPSPAASASSITEVTTRRTNGSSRATACGVKALFTSALSFVCRGGSVITRVPCIIW